MGESESQFDTWGPPSTDVEDEDINDLVDEVIDDAHPRIVNVTNVSPYLPGLDPNKVQLPFWLLWVLIAMAALAIGEFVGLLVL